MLYLIEFLHQTTTNSRASFGGWLLYLIEFLHQTTTMKLDERLSKGCILLNFYIKPQQEIYLCRFGSCCILLNFYIKPQRYANDYGTRKVVSYWISTSNHNQVNANEHWCWVVSYWISTSNHNLFGKVPKYAIVVSYWISTSNHNLGHCNRWFLNSYAYRAVRKVDTCFPKKSLRCSFRISKNEQIYQKNSSCCGISGLARSILPQKFKMSPYCLSVTLKILVYPEDGIERLTRLMCTSIFSFDEQCRTYTEYCIIEKPSFSSALRNCAAWRLSVFVFVGKSKNTNSHIIR